jgi:hypothetical protein
MEVKKNCFKGCPFCEQKKESIDNLNFIFWSQEWPFCSRDLYWSKTFGKKSVRDLYAHAFYRSIEPKFNAFVISQVGEFLPIKSCLAFFWCTRQALSVIAQNQSLWNHMQQLLFENRRLILVDLENAAINFLENCWLISQANGFYFLLKHQLRLNMRIIALVYYQRYYSTVFSFMWKGLNKEEIIDKLAILQRP